MKKLLLLFLLISYTYCSLLNCQSESTQANCGNHDIEFNDFSCYKLTNEIGNEGCTIFPDKSENQQLALNFHNGMQKEIFSITAQSESDFTSGEYDMHLIQSEKETYSKGEVIKFNRKELTPKDKSAILSQNTCNYLYIGRYLKITQEMEAKNDFSNFKEKINIPDKDLCFNSEQMPELQNLVDCGYADVNIITEDNKRYNYKTCFYLPNEKMPEEFKPYFRTVYLQNIFTGSISGIVSAMEAYDIYEENKKLISEEEEEDDGSRRRLTNPSFEVIVEDKNGKKIKYSSSSMTIENYSEGSGNGSAIRYNAILLFVLSLFLLIG